MATCNYSKRNAQAYYVINSSDEDELGLKLENVEYYGELNGMRKDSDGLLYKEYFFRDGCISECLLGTVDYNGGYYENGNLDWEISFNTCGGEYIYFSDFFGVEDFASAVADYISDYYEVEDKPSLERLIAANLQKIVRELDGFCESNCDELWERLGCFNNGSALYKRVA